MLISLRSFLSAGFTRFPRPERYGAYCASALFSKSLATAYCNYCVNADAAVLKAYRAPIHPEEPSGAEQYRFEPKRDHIWVCWCSANFNESEVTLYAPPFGGSIWCTSVYTSSQSAARGGSIPLLVLLAKQMAVSPAVRRSCNALGLSST
jgi:hypothetical protein